MTNNKEDIDTNVENYTISELITISGINDIKDQNDIINQTNYFIQKFKNKPNYYAFFKEIQSVLLRYSKDLEKQKSKNANGKIIVEGFSNITNKKTNIDSNDANYIYGEKQVNDWYTNEVLEQKNNPTQTDRIPDRKQKIEVFGNQYVPMNREQIATVDSYLLPVKQDSLNPNLKNTITRFINLDSQYRQYTNGVESTSTDYTLNLSDNLKDVLTLRLYSYQIPYSWYAIDELYGNTYFWIIDGSNNINIPIYVPSGNYTQNQFQNQLNYSILSAGFTFPARTIPIYPYTLPANTPVYFNSNSGILTLFLYNGTYNDPTGSGLNFIIDTKSTIVFFDFSGSLQKTSNCSSMSNRYFNTTLGWLMGFRVPYEIVNIEGNIASSILDLNGTKYLILSIDDYNQNHVNNSLISIAEYSNTLKVPSYYSNDLPYFCSTPQQQTTNLTNLVNSTITETLLDNQTTNVQNGLLIGGKYEQDYTPTQIVLPSAPSTLTNAQIYTINEINKNRNNLTNYLVRAPTTSDVLTLIPVKTSIGVPTGSLLVEFGGTLQDNRRVFFGPVNIERMAVKLLDDKGRVLNLNGNDWCVTLVAECLYQY